MSEPFPYHEQPEGLRLSPSLGLDDDQEARLRDYAWQAIVTGHFDAEDFCETVEDDPDLEDLDLDDAVLTETFVGLLAARRAQQQAWPQEVRETALTRAFADLEEIGVVARDNFTCCGSCASAEIFDEFDDSRAWRGYVYFHQQDAERIPETRETYVGYGAAVESYMTEDEWDALGEEKQNETYNRLVDNLMREEVIPIFERHGIAVEWDGDLNTRILLKNVDWYAEVTAEDANDAMAYARLSSFPQAGGRDRDRP